MEDHDQAALVRLREIVKDDSYAGTFQSFGQYRGALLKHIANLLSAPAAPTSETESIMDKNTTPPLAALAYSPEHPYPKALARVAELETLLADSSIVDTRSLTRYTAVFNGRMQADQTYGPWLLYVDVLGAARPLHNDDLALARFAVHLHAKLAAQRSAGRGGWESPSLCSVGTLAASLIEQIRKGDLVDIAIYAMMLHERGATASTIAAAIALAEAEEAIERPAATGYTREDAETFAQALIASGWHNDSLYCVEGLHALLQGFLHTHAGA